ERLAVLAGLTEVLPAGVELDVAALAVLAVVEDVAAAELRVHRQLEVDTDVLLLERTALRAARAAVLDRTDHGGVAVELDLGAGRAGRLALRADDGAPVQVEAELDVADRLVANAEAERRDEVVLRIRAKLRVARDRL